MEPENPLTLEQIIDRKLKELPTVQAPSSLIQNVMANIEALDAKPWWQKAFTDWPSGSRAILVTMLLALAVTVVAGLGQIWPENPVASVTGMFSQSFETVRPYWNSLVAVVTAGKNAAGAIHQGWWIATAVLLFFMYSSCLLVGTAFYRVLTNKFPRYA